MTASRIKNVGRAPSPAARPSGWIFSSRALPEDIVHWIKKGFSAISHLAIPFRHVEAVGRNPMWLSRARSVRRAPPARLPGRAFSGHSAVLKSEGAQ